MEKDVYDEMEAFIAMQDKEWEIHCRELGWFRRLLERFFGSKFAKHQSFEFELFLMNKGIKS
jgi:hypothetical protein